jgi:hypothetical protein
MARTLPTMPTWSTGQEITSSLLNQITTYTQFWANPPMFRMYQATVQSIPTATFTQAIMDTPVYDSDTGRSGTSPYSYVIPFAGRWTFKLGVGYVGNATGFRIDLLYQNGSAVTGSQVAEPAMTASSDMPGRSLTIPCNVGDVMAVYTYQNSGGALNTDVGGSGGNSFFEGRLVSLASP